MTVLARGMHRRRSLRGATGAAGVPPLDGELSTRDADLVAASTDFGHRIRQRPLAVLRPAAASDVASIVRFARDAGLPLAARGAGHSVDGQTLVRNGIVVDLTSLAGVGPVGPDRIEVQAGARWDAVVDATLPAGLTPPVLPDHLALTVGGTVSAGGVGGTSHRYGSVADNVVALQVVTREGELVACPPELFDEVRATQGEHGIITGVTLALDRAPETVRLESRPHATPGALLRDQLELVSRPEVRHVTGLARRVADRWEYVAEVAADGGPHGYREFLDRLIPIERRLRATGGWQRDPHPRCTVLLPGRHAAEVIADVLAWTGPDDLGATGSVLIYPIPTERLRAPRLPRADDDVTVVFGMQRTAPRDDPSALERMLRANEALRATAVRLGGAVYAGR